jgi:hypothetical protein
VVGYGSVQQGRIALEEFNLWVTDVVIMRNVRRGHVVSRHPALFIASLHEGLCEDEFDAFTFK